MLQNFALGSKSILGVKTFHNLLYQVSEITPHEADIRFFCYRDMILS